MTKYYAVDVRDVTDTTAWYNQMTALGFNLEDHCRKQNFNNTYWFYFDEDKNYITYLREEDCNYLRPSHCHIHMSLCQGDSYSPLHVSK